jgi:hypothetical protein
MASRQERLAQARAKRTEAHEDRLLERFAPEQDDLDSPERQESRARVRELMSTMTKEQIRQWYAEAKRVQREQGPGARVPWPSTSAPTPRRRPP